MASSRWERMGGKAEDLTAVATWAVPAGLVGARLYHVATDYQRFQGDWLDAFKIWNGGLGIWGAIALGGVGAWIGCRRRRIKLPPFADALAPGIAVAQAIGRLGNYFNQELYGRTTDVPWALHITCPNQDRPCAGEGFYHPTFLYELLWNVGVAALVIWADRRFKLGHGRAFALYVAAFCVGRGWIEYLRIDPVEADDVFGLRLNVWTSLVLFVAAVAYFIWSSKRHPGREESVLREDRTTVEA
jgi:prolipoprotein diacylglyceryl transferase